MEKLINQSEATKEQIVNEIIEFLGVPEPVKKSVYAKALSSHTKNSAQAKLDHLRANVKPDSSYIRMIE